MNKTTLILAIVFIVLIGLFFISRKGPKVERGALADSLAKLDSLSISRIDIKAGFGPLSFVKEGTTWMMTSPVSYRANQDFVQDMVKAFIDLRVESSISENPAKHAKFEVDTAGAEVVFYKGDTEMTSLVVGKTSPDFSHTYVREAGKPEVFLVKGVLSGQLGRSIDNWRDKTIFSAEKTDITGLTLIHPDEAIMLFWTGGNWMMNTEKAESLAVDQQTVDRMLSTLTNFRTSLFPAEEEYAEVYFDKPDFRMDITSVSGSASLLMVEEAEENRYFVKKEGDPTVFQVYKGSVSNLMKKAEDLKAKEEAPPPPPPGS